MGDQNVLAEMLKHDFNVGGEQSGHIIFRDYSTTGDGLVAALQILRVMKASGKPLSQLAGVLDALPANPDQHQSARKKPARGSHGLPALCAKAEAELRSQGGRIFLRYSGTEPKIRLLLEGPKAPLLQRWNHKISSLLQTELGA